ncbi:MAG TPA: TIGR03067 domain-containing protein [Gemmataceae bacterium]|jgi:uncharacterized protein (TIGR03067 family)|nr:TIGR03067 domain-containing protein [Gemmataceae bacterium]
MSWRNAILATLLPTLALAGSARADDKEDAKAELKKLAGDWYKSHGLSGGFVVTVQGFSLVMFFQDDQVKSGRMFGPEDVKSLDTWKVTVDPSKSPKTIDMTRTKDGKTVKRIGIYESKDNDLKFSWAEDGKERPTKFDDKTTAIEFYYRMEKKK